VQPLMPSRSPSDLGALRDPDAPPVLLVPSPPRDKGGR
jgi:hypothetical protein